MCNLTSFRPWLLWSSLICAFFITSCESNAPSVTAIKWERRHYNPTKKDKKKTPEERALFDEARIWEEFIRQVNPNTGRITLWDKQFAHYQALRTEKLETKGRSNNVTPRGPNNLGGRTRALAFDISDATNQTLLAGGVSSGLFRSTNGGNSWTRVSSTSDIHNVTCIAQDPRPGNQNTWYYGTGEFIGNSTSLSGAFYFGNGIWRSTDGGITWNILPGTSSGPFSFDSYFDFSYSMAVHPTTGDLFVATALGIVRYDISSSSVVVEKTNGGSTCRTDVVISSTGRVYGGLGGAASAAAEGVWTSTDATGGTAGTWTRIATAGTPTNWASAGRLVLALAPSNENILYALYNNGAVSNCAGTEQVEADLWQYDQSSGTWTDYTAKLPNESGCLNGNDPFAIQGGYDLEVSVKPDDENFVVIGGTNAYKIEDIVTDPMFVRIGGYANSGTYAKYSESGDTHHPDVHALVFAPNAPSILYSGTDGGIHRTADIGAATVVWENKNTNYVTYQYYHVNIDPQAGSDILIGGAQDNGTSLGGTGVGNPDAQAHIDYFSGDGAATAIARTPSCVLSYVSTQRGSMYRLLLSGSGCPSFTTITPSGVSSRFVTYFYMDPENNEAIYYAGESDLLRTTSASTVTPADWTNVLTLPSSHEIISMATTQNVTTQADRYLFIGTDGGVIYRLQDPENALGPTNLVDITPASASTTFPSIVNDITTHPTGSDTVIAAYSNYGVPSIFLTQNATSATPTWTNVERNISGLSVRTVSVLEANGRSNYFAGTNQGLYYSPDPLTTDWVQVAPNSIGYSVVSSMALRANDNNLAIGTHGNGMFLLDVDQVLDANEQLPLYADYQNQQVQLRWDIQRPNWRNFQVERSVDGIQFEAIAQIPASQSLNYQTIDPNPTASPQYYRLRGESLDGSFTYSAIAVVRMPDLEEIPRFTLLGNPIQESLRIAFASQKNERVHLELFDRAGQKLRETYTQTNTLEYTWSLPDLPTGSYVLSITRPNGNIFSQLVVKQ